MSVFGNHSDYLLMDQICIQVVITFGKPLYIDAYTEEFFSDKEGSPRSAVKRLTADIETALVEATINAPDW